MLKQNGNQAIKGKLITVPEMSTTLEHFKEMLENDYNVSNSSKYTFFNQDGIVITDETFILIKDGDTIYYDMTPGNPFDFNNVLAQYETIKKLGKGGYGSVYQARHKETNKMVAIKYMDITEYSILLYECSVSCREAGQDISRGTSTEAAIS